MKIKFLVDGAKMPCRADNGSAGYDLYLPADVTICPGRNVIPLGFSIALDSQTEAQIRPRSGFSVKGIEGYLLDNVGDHENAHGICYRRFNADVILGTVDESYRGEVGVIIKSHESIPFIIPKGTRIAQMVISPYCSPEIQPVSELDTTERSGGFGHTGSL